MTGPIRGIPLQPGKQEPWEAGPFVLAQARRKRNVVALSLPSFKIFGTGLFFISQAVLSIRALGL